MVLLPSVRRTRTLIRSVLPDDFKGEERDDINHLEKLSVMMFMKITAL